MICVNCGKEFDELSKAAMIYRNAHGIPANECKQCVSSAGAIRYYSSLSEEEREEVRSTKARQRREWWASLTDDEYADIIHKFSNRQRFRWACMSAEEKEDFVRKASERRKGSGCNQVRMRQYDYIHSEFTKEQVMAIEWFRSLSAESQADYILGLYDEFGESKKVSYSVKLAQTERLITNNYYTMCDKLGTERITFLWYGRFSRYIKCLVSIQCYIDAELYEYIPNMVSMLSSNHAELKHYRYRMECDDYNGIPRIYDYSKLRNEAELCLRLIMNLAEVFDTKVELSDFIVIDNIINGMIKGTH
jgi:hypothetical protein